MDQNNTEDGIGKIDLESLKEAFAPYENALFGLPDTATQTDREVAREARHQEWLTEMRAKLDLSSDASEPDIQAAIRTQFLADRGLPSDTSDEIIAQIRRKESDDRYLAMALDKKNRIMRFNISHQPPPAKKPNHLL